MNMVKKIYLQSSLAALLIVAAPGFAADTDVFSGIYSVVNPETGAEVDVMKIRKYEDGYGVFSYLGGDEVQRGSISAAEAEGTSASSLRVLALNGQGKLYYVPKGAESPAGRSDTGYISDIMGLANFPLKRRPLAAKRERGINGIHAYVPPKDERPVSIRALNHGGKPIQLGVSSATNGQNAADTDPIHGYMASAFNCCFYLPETWNASLRLNVEIWSSDGKLRTVPVALPKYDTPENFEVAVNPDGRAEVLFGRSDQDRPLPRSPVVKR
ncbi:hypothetical protein GTP55_18020 [Duganella sp. FT109W]|uniref:Uncharacterized protein n=1 Tax=Duganella margarita TaxID=2692170 RepID=A0ABW9WJG4_9BURK|nr:hypothetical protein [Duganella margarita]MYN41263.1 hypothetical protein [Duganella margarita]